jgi:gamma-glutamyltranspeptidase/glutathione hydrolase
VAATGSGGSNRIRSAILQVLSNIVDYRMGVREAVIAPRIHLESGLLNLEPPRSEAVLDALSARFPQRKLWNDLNLFFGGAHTVVRNADGRLNGMGDPRRGGACQIVRGAPET